MRLGGRVAIALSVAATVLVSGVAPVSGAGKEPFTLPANASEIAQGVFFLGTVVKDGVMVDGYVFETDQTAIRGRGANARPPKPGGGGATSGCYSFISAGASWRTIENYEVDPASVGVGVAIHSAFGLWDTAAGKNLVGPAVSPTSDLVADTLGPDGRNEVYSGAVTDNGVLGYTIVWSTRGTRRIPGQIVEADMVIDNDGDWTWGSQDGDFDLGTVVLHEAGHWVGLGHTNTTAECADQVMYPYVNSNEVKSLLGAGDIAGIKALYGS